MMQQWRFGKRTLLKIISTENNRTIRSKKSCSFFAIFCYVQKNGHWICLNIDMSKKKREFDINITEALQRIKWPLNNYCGTKIVVRKSARNENGFEHIAGKKHQLKVRDIEMIPKVLEKPLKVIMENKGRHGKSYFGKRKGDNKSKFLKIVVRTLNGTTEEIVTIYTTRNIK